MEQEHNKQQVLQWHPAFFAGIQVEFLADKTKLIFENEHQLGTKPKEIDVLIIKKNEEDTIETNIGRIFRKHNIVEYKSPEDYLSVDDYYKVYGYACFYKADTGTTDEIKAEEITISFVCRRYPHKLVKHWKQVQHLTITKKEAGIYYIMGTFFPMQLIITSRLSKEKNFWLRNLTNDLQSTLEAREIAEEFRKHKDNQLYHSVMDLIIRANIESFKEVTSMDAILELFKDEVEERLRENTEQVTLQVHNRETRQSLYSVMKNLDLSLEEAMNVLDIPEEERANYL